MDAGGERERLHAARFGPAEDPQRTITVVAPAKMKDYFEVDSEVPVAPFPTTHRELQSDELGWSDEEVGVGDEKMMREPPAEGHEEIQVDRGEDALHWTA